MAQERRFVFICAVTAKLFSMPLSTAVPSSQSLHVAHCMRVMFVGMAALMTSARCTSQTPLLPGRYLPSDQARDLVKVPLNCEHMAPKAFLPEFLIVVNWLVTAARLYGSEALTPLSKLSVHWNDSSSQGSER